MSCKYNYTPFCQEFDLSCTKISFRTYRRSPFYQQLQWLRLRPFLWIHQDHDTFLLTPLHNNKINMSYQCLISYTQDLKFRIKEVTIIQPVIRRTSGIEVYIFVLCKLYFNVYHIHGSCTILFNTFPTDIYILLLMNI